MILASPSHLFTCFCIRGEGGVGTAFAFNHGSTTFFLTAAHVLGGAALGSFVYLKRPSDWLRCELSEVRPHPSGCDASMFSIKGLEVEVDHHFTHRDDPKLHLGDELKFTGFPHGLENTAASPLGFSTPLVRTAFFSGVVVDKVSGASLLILDGLNNPGYSGGPVWSSGAEASRPHLLGLISGYRVEERGKSRVYEALPEGAERALENMFVKPNSGMIHAIPYADLAQLINSV